MKNGEYLGNKVLEKKNKNRGICIKNDQRPVLDTPFCGGTDRQEQRLDYTGTKHLNKKKIKGHTQKDIIYIYMKVFGKYSTKLEGTYVSVCVCIGDEEKGWL